MTSDWDRGQPPSMNIGTMSGLRPTEEQKLRSAVAYLVHMLGGVVTVPDEVSKTFGTEHPLYQVSPVYDDAGQRGYKAWETPGLPLDKRVAQAVYVLRLHEDEEISDGWQLERVMWLLTNGVEGAPHHDKMKGAETRETS